jgi:hypothetical protein
VNPPDTTWRPFGFLLLVVGFGLRLDTPWQGLAWVFLVAGTVSAGAGLWMLARRRAADGAFVATPGRQ